MRPCTLLVMWVVLLGFGVSSVRADDASAKAEHKTESKTGHDDGHGNGHYLGRSHDHGHHNADRTPTWQRA